MTKICYVAVRKYKNVLGAPSGAPGEYPEKVVILGENNTPPDNSGVWDVMTDFQCAALIRSLKTQWNAYQAQVAAEKYVTTRIKAAMAFGTNLMAEYGAQNVVSGKTVANIMTLSTKLATLQSLLQSGSLYAALDEIDRITPDALLTQATKDQFKVKIRKYLGI